MAVVSEIGDRLSAAFLKLLRAFLGFKAAKSIDACALYFGKVVKVTGSKVEVQLDSPDIGSPTSIPLYLGFPGSSVAGIEGSRVLVGFRNGDPTQAYAIAFEFSSTVSAITIGQSSPQPAARTGDNLTASSALGTWAGVVETALSSAGHPVAPASIFSLTVAPPGDLGAVHGGSGTVKIGG